MTKYLSENAFNNSPYKALKVSSYFETYDLHLKPYFGKPVTVVEVGVLHGGSLFMWRELFGPQARIIGIDLNPNATKWRKYGFEIYIGNQESPTFWSEFFGSVGNVDIVLDDGAHTNRAHLVTLFSCIPKVNNGGLILIEDTHTDFEQSFGNPSIISISNIGRNLTQLLTTYGNRNRKNDLINPISSIAFHESIIVFRINRVSRLNSKAVVNLGILDNAKDFRNSGGQGLLEIDNKIRTRLSQKSMSRKKAKVQVSALKIYLQFRIFILKLDNLSLYFWFKKQMHKNQSITRKNDSESRHQK